jgi:hypothetical protein
VFADLRVMMALTTLGASPAALPAALELSEDSFTEIFGAAYVMFVSTLMAGKT